ncbi:MAG: hypothetical protein U9Q82_13985 [Chloroflexota bacterium]|nr:hypothetical protein [Chloroflexota bacterium]
MYKLNIAKIITVLAISLVLAARLIPGPRTIDDAYITYRYARNILAEEGFVYNPGERVLGTTTPLYTLTLAAVGAVTGGTKAPFPSIALLINTIADAVTAVLLWKLGKRLKFPYAGAGAALVWAIAPFSVTFAIGGLETSVYVLLLTATVYAHIAEKHKLTALFAALSILTRPDALLLLAPLALDRLASHVAHRTSHPARPKLLPELLIFLAAILPWFTFATLYFGSPIPHSVTAKTLAYRLPSTTALTRLLQHYATPFLGHLTFGLPWIGVGLILYPALAFIGIRAALRSTRRLWPWAIYPWLYFAAFAIANPLIFRWYLTPPLPAYFFFIFIGIEELGNRAIQNRPDRGPHSWKAILLPIIIALPLLTTIRGWTLTPDHGPRRPAPEMAWFELELLYRQAAQRVNRDIEATSSQSLPVLAAGDVGVLGYYTPTRILDTVGLNSPQTLDYYPLNESYYVINYAIPPNLIRDQKPNYVVILEVYGREGLLEDPYFKENYALLHKLPTDIYGSDGMLIYKKQ